MHSVGKVDSHGQAEGSKVARGQGTPEEGVTVQLGRSTRQEGAVELAIRSEGKVGSNRQAEGSKVARGTGQRRRGTCGRAGRQTEGFVHTSEGRWAASSRARRSEGNRAAPKRDVWSSWQADGGICTYFRREVGSIKQGSKVRGEQGSAEEGRVVELIRSVRQAGEGVFFCF